MFCKQELKLRGWTERAIKRFLGEPHAQGFNQYCESRPLHLYWKSQVKAVENSAEFVRWKLKIDKQRKKRRLKRLEKLFC